ncbi:MAG: PaaI family thioesterase [Holophagaceae bacterium]
MAAPFTPLDPGYAARVRGSFARQGAMGLVGAELHRVEPGLVEIGLAFRPDLSQQHGFFHAGVSAMIADSAGGYAAFTLFPADASVLTVEFKLNLLAPARGERLKALGRVLRAGRTLAVCELQVFALAEGRESLCATGLQTVMRLDGRPDA